jgi:arylsulfatase A
VLPALLGEAGAKGRDHLLQQDNNGVNLGLRMGEWKLVRSKQQGKPKAIVTLKQRAESNRQHRLYHLPKDPAELKDLSAQHPEKTQEMIARLESILAAGRTRN